MDHNNITMNTERFVVHLQIQGHEQCIVNRDLHSYYPENLGSYFHIIEVMDHNNDIINTAIVTTNLQIILRGLPYLRGVSAIKRILVYISTLSRSGVM